MGTELVSKYTQALAAVMPQGYAWPRDPASVQMRVVRGLAGSLAEFDENVANIVRQWQPATTVARLAEWEQATGLPDACFGPNQTQAQRRDMLLRRLRGHTLPFADSSPAAPGVLLQYLTALGYSCWAQYNWPARVGLASVGTVLGALDGRLYINIYIGGFTTRARVGQSKVGDPLSSYQNAPTGIECYMRRIVPARFLPVIHYVNIET